MTNTSIKTIIVDDEKNARNAICGLLSINHPEIDIVGQADGVFSAIECIKKHKPQLVFLDIKLQDGTGFDVLTRLNTINFCIVFLTAYDEHALKAFRHEATDYLLKPIDPDELQNALQKVKKQLSSPNLNIENLLQNTIKHNNKLILKTSESIHLVNIEEIIRCEGSGNYTSFHITNRPVLMVSKPLKDYEDKLRNNGFFRSHQSHLVNLSLISEISKRDGTTIICIDGSEVPVAVRKREALLKIVEDL